MECQAEISPTQVVRAKRRDVRVPGVEPGTTAWKAAMLTVTPHTRKRSSLPAIASGTGNRIATGALDRANIISIMLMMTHGGGLPPRGVVEGARAPVVQW